MANFKIINAVKENRGVTITEVCGAEVYENQRMTTSSVSASLDFENGGVTMLNSRPIYFSAGEGIRN